MNDVAAPNPRKPMEQDLVPFATMEADLKRLDLRTDTAIATALGYKAGRTVGKWRETGKAPRVARLALEGLVRRQGQDFGKPKLLLLRVDDPDTANTVTTLLKALSIKWTEL